MSDEYSSFRSSLPIFKHRREIIDAIKANLFTIVIGETGSGKSTQIAQYCFEENLFSGKICVSQPRRVGAISLSRRIAQEMNTSLGDGVGYTIRFEDKSSEDTKIHFMTDGCLLRECIRHKDLSPYSLLIIDEAHERSLFTDMLLVLARSIGRKRARENNFRVVITSATLNAQKFSSFFDDCGIFHISGRCFPVQIEYVATRLRKQHYLTAIVEQTLEAHIHNPLGDILVFLTGREEIEKACEMLGEKIDSALEDGIAIEYDVVILPCYASMPAHLQYRIFQPTEENCRKIIFSTNLCETSLTVSTVSYVIDSGLVKQKMFHAQSGMESLEVCEVSKVQAVQRAGRAGRTKSGICYRMYSEKNFDAFAKESVPEILRCNLANSVLILKEMGVGDIAETEFIDPPHPLAIENALIELYRLEALTEKGEITNYGRLMSRFPVSPPLAKFLLLSVRYDCSEEALTIVALLASKLEQLWQFRTRKNKNENKEKLRFFTSDGDHFMYLNVYRHYTRAQNKSELCRRHDVQERVLRSAERVRVQLHEILTSVAGRGNSFLSVYERLHSDVSVRVKQCLAGSFFIRCARRVNEFQYKLYRGSLEIDDAGRDEYFYISPESVFQAYELPRWVIYNNCVVTSKPFLRSVSHMEYEWLKPYFHRLTNRKILDTVQFSRHELEESEEKTEKFQTAAGVKKTEKEPKKKRDISMLRQRFLERKSAAKKKKTHKKS